MDILGRFAVERSRKIVAFFFPEIENEVVKVVDLLNNGLVVPLGKIDELYYTFVDNRNENEVHDEK